ncbi:MAG: hypothetical protein J07HQX50_00114 [Haloquadratum sp. J07HQX50]|jgi:hypothetical protein|nr:MAG: hypothetical protein J07HQX50_00114 [Haloquadratum sp. J07HQX50]
MAEPPEFWAFLMANSFLFIAGGTLSILGYRAYIRTHQRALRLASGGFTLITFGGLLELVYQLGIRQDYHLGGRESLALQTAESLTITAGLVVIFYALSQY